jgi:hypothetical protein
MRDRLTPAKITLTSASIVHRQTSRGGKDAHRLNRDQDDAPVHSRGLHMQIHLMTMWYNESLLAPWFLRHYNWVDRIIIFFDTSTTDNCADVIASVADPMRVQIVPISLGGHFNEAARIQIFQDYYDTYKDCDYYIIADADEFIFCRKPEESARAFIGRNGRSITFVKLYNVYPHVTDGPLNYAEPLWSQRRHGDDDLSTWPNSAYIKPNILKSDVPARFRNGFHALDLPTSRLRLGDDPDDADVGCCRAYRTLDYNRYEMDLFEAYNASYADDSLIGMHAHMCDLDLAIRRKLKDRVPRSRSKWYKLWAETDMAALFKKHERDPLLW